MTVSKLRFNFETCEYAEIDGKYIGDFLIDDINYSIHRNSCKSIEPSMMAKTIVIELHKNANKEHGGYTKLFDRVLQYDDIVSVEFSLVNQFTETQEDEYEEEHFYFVDWDGDDYMNNPNQKSYVSECGNLYLVISKDDDIEDFFDKEDINDEKFMDIYFSSYGVDGCGKNNEYEDTYNNWFCGMTPEEYEDHMEMQDEYEKEHQDFSQRLSNGTDAKALDILNRYKSGEMVTVKEAEMLYKTILEWKERADMYDSLCD